MVYVIKLKKAIHRDLVEAVSKNGEGTNEEQFIAAEELKTGLTAATIANIIKNMSKIKYIKIENGTITRVQQDDSRGS